MKSVHKKLYKFSIDFSTTWFKKEEMTFLDDKGSYDDIGDDCSIVAA